jgi:hypothetical protein
VSFIDSDGIQNGWKKIDRKPIAMTRAQKTVLIVSTKPPS